nr:hypothetical protein [Ktedonobacterales bacterium]
DLGRAYSAGGAGTLAGDGFPLVLRGGRAVASWSHRFEGQRMRVTVTAFASDPLPPSRYEQAFAAVGQLLGASAIEVVAAMA